MVDLLPQFDLLTTLVLPTEGGHFSYLFWLPLLRKGVHMDTYSTADHYECADAVFPLFMEHCSGSPQSERLYRKDESTGIEQQ
jgi:hypothetical protein